MSIVLKNCFVIKEDILLDIVEDTSYWESHCCDEDGYSTILTIESLKSMKKDLIKNDEISENKINKIEELMETMVKVAVDNGLKFREVEFIVRRGL